MRTGALSRLKHAAKRAAGLLRPSVAILMHHRVHDAVADPWDLCVSPAHFEEQMQYLRRHHAVLGLRRLTELLAAGRLPRRAVVLTFDDGYVDNLLVAKPILERWELPATFFVTTGKLGEPRDYWWDELSRIFLEAGSLPATLDVALSDGPLRHELADAAVYTEEDCRRHRGWRASADGDPTARHAIVRALNERLYARPEQDKREALSALFAWAKLSPQGRASDRTLSPDELIAAEDGGLIEIGAHSVTHPVLTSLPAAAQRDEITQCKSRLEEVLGHPVSSFCYPHGAYSAQTVAFVRDAAFASACSVVSRPLGPDADPFQLPRMHAGDWNGEEFGRRLRSCMALQ
jgi:peptidoglycan/xylan/chitin deacetylase (PgdA/CDA1 family)